jgi:L-threonylcarbamoyladenylate synthase
MNLIRVDHGVQDSALVREVAQCLKGGGVVGMRSDTVYGLLASVNRPDALRRLVQLKVRPVSKPFVLLAADWIGVRSVTSHLPPVARRLGTKYWPGALTLVLPAASDLPEEVRAAGPTVAIRIPADGLVWQILREVRAALAAPSANLPGLAPARSADEVVETFGTSIDLVLDGGNIGDARPSTIVNCTGTSATVVRTGAIELPPTDLVAL